jgi:hypothetical protein
MLPVRFSWRKCPWCTGKPHARLEGMSAHNEIVPYAEVVEEPAAPRVLPYRVTGYDGTLPLLRTGSWSKFAIAAFVLMCLLPWSAGLTALPAIVLGHLGLRDTRAKRRRGRVMAILALVGGYVTVVAFITIIILAVSFSHPV